MRIPAGAASLLLALGCDVESPEPARAAGPEVNLVSARVTTAGPTQSEIAPGGSTQALANLRIELVFDRYLDPSTVTRQAVCLRSDPAPVKTLGDCKGGVLLNVAYDPAGRVVTYYVDPGQTPPLLPAATHFLTLHQASGDGPGFRAFDGARLAERRELFFDVVDPGNLEPQLPPELDDVACDQTETSFGRCASCHTRRAAGEDGPAVEPPEGLELSSLERALATGTRVAHGASLGGTGNETSRSPDRFGSGMPVFSPGDPGNSYLLYKMLAAIDVDAATLAPGETDRLRGGLITGMPMPPDNVRENRPSADDVRKISAWIRSCQD